MLKMDHTQEDVEILFQLRALYVGIGHAYCAERIPHKLHSRVTRETSRPLASHVLENQHTHALPHIIALPDTDLLSDALLA